MLTATSQYALRAVSLLARTYSRGLVPAKQIAVETAVPHKYLSAILTDLVRGGALEAAPGPRGGFRLARPPDELPLYDVLEPFEPMLWKQRPCPFGQSICSDEDACGGHEHWKKVREAYLDFLHRTTVLDVAANETVDGEVRIADSDPIGHSPKKRTEK